MTTTKLTDDQIRELCILTTRDEAGRHFTVWSEHYASLEAAGLVEINRPVHAATGIPYGQEHWTLEVTDEGRKLVDANPELHPSDADADEQLVCGCQVQHDNSGVGHNWRNIDRESIPANALTEIEGEIIDGGKAECDDFVASNGLHYRWS
jgi:hypothetical protein